MSLPSSPLRHAWIPVLLLAATLVAWTDARRIARVEAVTASVPADVVVSPDSPTGYAGGLRTLVVADQNNDSTEWIVQTQQMLATKEWRLRHIAYENAPFGRDLTTPSPYRWWLGLVAWLNRTATGQSAGRSVEAAALNADAALHLLLLIGVTLYVARHFGPTAAALAAAGLAGCFPLAATFLPGAPDDQGLALGLGLLSLLPLLAGLLPRAAPADPTLAARRQRRAFLLAGILGGLGLWVSVRVQFPLLLGVTLGGLLAARVRRADAVAPPLPWLTWALGGAAGSLVAYLIEFYPSNLGNWQLRTIHPLYCLAWIGLGLLLALLSPLLQRQPARWNAARGATLAGAGLALAALPVAMIWTKNSGFLSAEVASFKLTRLASAPEATHFWAWLAHDGITALAGLVVLPGLLLLPGLWLLVRPATGTAARTALAVALGPVAVALGFAQWRLSWWSGFDITLLALLCAATVALDSGAFTRGWRWTWSVAVLGVFLAGIPPALPPSGPVVLEGSEFAGLIERDLAHWLAKRVGPGKAVVLAPPTETIACQYYGGLPGLGSLSPDNQEGITAVVRILSATTPQEAQALVERRGVTHFIIPSWDSYLNEYVRAGTAQVENTFLGGLRNWALPPWLRAVPYQMPAVAGYEGQSVAVLEVVEEQTEATSLGRLAVYFVESGRLDYATAIERELQRFPADVGAQVARAEVQVARGDEPAVRETLKALTPKLAAGADRALSWERRAGLAVVLFRLKETELARAQTRRCLAELTEARARGLSTGALYRLLALGKHYGVGAVDPSLRARVLDLLPPESRARL